MAKGDSDIFIAIQTLYQLCPSSTKTNKMDLLLGPQSFDQRHTHPSPQYHYISSHPNEYESPRVLNSNHYRNYNQADDPVSPDFYREPTHSEYYLPEHIPNSPYSNKLVNEIKPRLDSILADQVSTNKEVQRGLQQLKNLQQRLVMDISQSYENSNGHNFNQGDYLSQINRIIDEIIANSEQQTNKFRSDLQDLRNVNENILNDDLEEEDEDTPPSQIERVQSKTHKFEMRESRNFQNFLDRLSSIEERLFNQIIILRQEKLQAISQLNLERERNHELERSYKQLERDYNRLASEVQERNPQNYRETNHRSNRHFEQPQARSRVHQRPKARADDGIRGQIDHLENRLRQASQEKVLLHRQIQRLRQSADPQTQQLMQDIKLLDSELAVSERKAAALFPHRVNNDRLIEELSKLRQQSNQLRQQTVFKQSEDLQKYKARQHNYDSNNYRSSTKQYEYEPRRHSRQPRVHKQFIQRESRDHDERLKQYRQVLNNIRSINR